MKGFPATDLFHGVHLFYVGSYNRTSLNILLLDSLFLTGLGKHYLFQADLIHLIL